MKNNIKLSVITPTYNRANKLEAHIQRILSQEFDNFEFIIVDDNSNDHTEDTVNKFDDNRLKYLKLNQNIGPTQAVYKGIELAKGEYIYMISDDDVLVDNHFFKIAMNFHEDIITGNYETIYNGKAVKQISGYDKEVYKAEEFLVNLKLFQSLIFGGNTIYKKTLFTEIVQEVEHDLAAIFLLLLHAKEVRVINKIVFNWYLDVNTETISTRNNNNLYKSLKLDLLFIDEVYVKLEKLGCLDIYSQILNKYIIEVCERTKHNYLNTLKEKIFKNLMIKIQNKNVYIYGKGLVGHDLANEIKKFGNFLGFVDDFRFEQDVEVIPLNKTDKEAFYIIATFKDSIKHKVYKKLICENIPAENIIELYEDE